MTTSKRVKGRHISKRDFSKQLICDIRSLLWIVTISGILLAFYCIRLGYLGTLPWISALVGLPWSAHGVVCSFYLNMSKSDHQKGGITYDLAINNQQQQQTTITDEPTI